MMLEAPDGRMLEWNSPEWKAQEFDASLPNPFSVVLPFLDGSPAWVVLVGLGDVDDGRQARRTWPNAKLIGFDPDPRAVAWQRAKGGWPKGAPLRQEALAGCSGIRRMELATICCASLHPANVRAAKHEDLVEVLCSTLDWNDRTHGPFDRCVLWLDCEGMDHDVLLGGAELLASGRVALVNFEVKYELPAEAATARSVLTNRGYELAKVWFRQHWGHNEIWIR